MVTPSEAGDQRAELGSSANNIHTNDLQDDIQIEVSDPAAYREFCLNRLRDLLTTRSQLAHETGDESRFNRRLVDRTIYAAYHDCVASGAKAAAARLIAVDSPA